MSDFSEVILMLAVFTYLFKEANDYVLTAAIGFCVFCVFNFIRSGYRAAIASSEMREKQNEWVKSYNANLRRQREEYKDLFAEEANENAASKSEEKSETEASEDK